jgi:thioredoxin reductase (NADPH)
LYAARDRLRVLLLEKGVVGGQVLVTDWIDNYPGFPEGLPGFDLIEKWPPRLNALILKQKIPMWSE